MSNVPYNMFGASPGFFESCCNSQPDHVILYITGRPNLLCVCARMRTRLLSACGCVMPYASLVGLWMCNAVRVSCRPVDVHGCAHACYAVHVSCRPTCMWVCVYRYLFMYLFVSVHKRMRVLCLCLRNCCCVVHFTI